MNKQGEVSAGVGVSTSGRVRFCEWFRRFIDLDRSPEYRDAHWDILRALLTQARADVLDGAEPIAITTQDLWRRVLEERGGPAEEVSPSRARNRLNAHWPTLETEFTELQGRFADAARKQGFEGLYWPRKVESQGGHPSTYFLEWRPFDKGLDEPKLPNAYTVLPGTLRYHEDKASLRFSLLGRLLLLPLLFRSHSAGAMRIEGLRRYVPAFALSSLVLVLGGLLLTALLPSTERLHWSPVLAAGVGYWLLLHPLVRLYDRWIVMASPLLYPFSEWDCQVELQWDAESSEAPRARGYTLRLVRYAADCPLCGGKVWLRDGGIEYLGRLVGRCIEEPTEHVFSFDRKLRAGYWLRASLNGRVSPTGLHAAPSTQAQCDMRESDERLCRSA